MSSVLILGPAAALTTTYQYDGETYMNTYSAGHWGSFVNFAAGLVGQAGDEMGSKDLLRSSKSVSEYAGIVGLTGQYVNKSTAPWIIILSVLVYAVFVALVMSLANQKLAGDSNATLRYFAYAGAVLDPAITGLALLIV
jgi:chromate transport protein ChrA